jgi:ABC-2 type transport system ATP-binding protein
VLKGVDFTIGTGEIFALLGSNGAGKTTAINIMTTLIKADGGSVTVGGFDVAKQPDKVRQRISLTGQFAAVDDILTARENLELIGDLRHVPHPARTATELLEQFGLTDAADRRVTTFSGGMRRRLDIAMSLIGNPSIIFLDEPTTGLDPEARTDMWRTIRLLAKGGTTIFLTTQYLDEADELADTIALLHHGTIVASGTAHELKKLVPGGLVELTFHDEKQRKTAISLLEKDYNVTNGDDLTVIVAAGESAAQLAGLFIKLRDAHIEPADFSQKVPTLDDVFMRYTGSTIRDAEAASGSDRNRAAMRMMAGVRR